MKKRTFLFFFSIVLSVYGLINLYIFVRGWEVVSEAVALRTIYVAVFLFVALSFIAGRFLERGAISWFSSALIWVGSFWLAAMVYLFFGILLIDILRLVQAIAPFLPQSVTSDPERTGHVVALLLTALVFIVVVAGHINARIPRVTTIHLAIPKNSDPAKSLNIVAVSDIHLGTIVSRSRLEKIVAKVNALHPDVILLPGDVIDEDIGPVIRQNLGETLRKLQAPLGTLAVTGNHEYIGGVDAACRYLVEHGIRVLRDESVKINEYMYVVGREDRSIRQFSGRRRRTLDELLAGIDRAAPIILMDHQPFQLEDAARNGIDLQLSGHTHHGQLWPFNFITSKVYEVSWGYKQKDATHFYVSCGVGTWGPPIRTGNRAEIVNILLSFA